MVLATQRVLEADGQKGSRHILHACVTRVEYV
jgi:hypothetical protein